MLHTEYENVIWPELPIPDLGIAVGFFHTGEESEVVSVDPYWSLSNQIYEIEIYIDSPTTWAVAKLSMSDRDIIDRISYEIATSDAHFFLNELSDHELTLADIHTVLPEIIA